MKPIKRVFIPIFVLLILTALFSFAYFWWRENSKAVSSETKPTGFVIPKGYSATQVANILYEQKLIRNPLAFKIYVQVTGKAKGIYAGEFKLSPNLTIPQLVDELSKGPAELWVTVPEGLRREEVVKKFIIALEMQDKQAEVFQQEFMVASEHKEGYLFPDTYLFPKDASASAVVKVMNQTFDKRINEDMKKAISGSKYSLDEIVTLASIIERETKSSEERPVVSGILYNRLEIGMGLQADATVQYALASTKCKSSQPTKCEWWPLLIKDDLKINSSYNTYKYTGLPPAPIANPGISSLKAALFPEKSDYLFYLHDSEGKIHFAKTLEEHNENVRRYLEK